MSDKDVIFQGIPVLGNTGKTINVKVLPNDNDWEYVCIKRAIDGRWAASLF